MALIVALSCGRSGPLPPHEPPVEEERPPVTQANALREVERDQFPLLLDDGDWDSFELALERNRRWLARQPDDRVFTFGPREVSVSELRAALVQLAEWLAADLSPEALAVRVAQAFDVLESVGDAEGEMLFTGYYVPVIEGSLRRSRQYNVPIYGPPGDLIRVDLGLFSERWKGMRTAGRLRGSTLVPYPDRSEIRQTNALRGREIAWAADRVDLFFIEIQGSGVLRLPDGRERRIGYAGANGREYRSIGRLLIDEGKIEREKVSMQSIRAYLAEHPDDVDRVLDYNTSVVFFRWLDGPPLGNLGFPVTAGRSIAVDQKLFPPGAFGFVQTDLPAMGADGRTVAEAPLNRFVFAQDRGGAIRGANRADFFWGRGAEAAERAGVMKQPGRLFFLVPRAEKEETTES
ncbi:MAG: MltA domain-containing protein [Acidobacteriota bacterium]